LKKGRCNKLAIECGRLEVKLISMKAKIKPYLVWFLMLFFFVLYSAWSINRYAHFQTDAIDLGLYAQTMWKYANFKAPLSSIKYDTFPGPNMLGDHFHPVLVLLVPFYWLWQDPRMLLLLQAAFVALAAWPIYMVAKKFSEHEFFSLCASFAYLAFIGVQTAIDYDFHVAALSVLPLSLTVYALIFDKKLLYWLAWLMGVLTKEDVTLFMVVIGFLAILKFKKEKLGVATMILSIAAYLLVTQLAIPYFKGDKFAYEELDPSLGVSTVDMIKTTVVSPWVTARVLFQPALKFKTITNLIAPFSFLPLFDPLSLLLLGPNFASRFLTVLSQRWLIRYQYSVNIAPLLAFGTIWGMANLVKVTGAVKFIARRTKSLYWFGGAALILTTLIQTYRTQTPLFRMFNPQLYQSEPRFTINNQLLSSIPKDSSVMAQSCFVPQLAHRDAIYRYEDTLFGKGIYPDYIIMSSTEHSDPPWSRPELEERIGKLRDNPRYEELFWDGERLLLKLLIKKD